MKLVLYKPEKCHKRYNKKNNIQIVILGTIKNQAKL
jgi:hypothetical protein